MYTDKASEDPQSSHGWWIRIGCSSLPVFTKSFSLGRSMGVLLLQDGDIMEDLSNLHEFQGGHELFTGMAP